MNAGVSEEDRAAFSARFAELADRAHEGWFTSKRKHAFEAFLAQGWPTKKQEDWRFTDLLPITESELLPTLAAQPSLDLSSFDRSLFQLGGQTPHRLVFVDGLHHREYGDGQMPEAGPVVAPLSAAMESDELRAHLGRHLGNRNAFAALNTAFMRDGAFVHIPAGFHEEAPICLVYLGCAHGITSFPRTLIVAGAGSQATVVEVYLGARGRAALCNAATEIVLGAEARLAYHTVQQPSPD
jgi:Fe-S cluster assembly protein SufD